MTGLRPKPPYYSTVPTLPAFSYFFYNTTVVARRRTGTACPLGRRRQGRMMPRVGGSPPPNITPTPTHRINAHDTDVTVVNLYVTGVAVGAMCSPWPSPLGGEGKPGNPLFRPEYDNGKCILF